jgi:hypothetical protein
VTIPIVNYGVPEPDIFFIWGFLLVMTLFLLGLMWYRAFSSVLHGSAPRKLYKTLGESGAGPPIARAPSGNRWESSKQPRKH